MVCSSCIRNVVVQAGHIGQSAGGSVQLRSIYRSLNASFGLKCNWNREFGSSKKMMVDTGATAKGGPIINLLPEKEDDVGYSSGGWKRQQSLFQIEVMSERESKMLEVL